MADSKLLAQEVIICDLCDKPTQQFCNSCQKNLCNECVNKHVDQLQSLAHEIVCSKNRNTQCVLPECKIHPGRRCEVQCQQCQIPICVKCCIGTHKNHDAVEVVELFEIKKQELQNFTDEIETKFIPKYNKTDADLQEKLTETTAKFNKMEEEKEVLRKRWHQEVDTIFDKLGSSISLMEENSLESIKTQQKTIKDTTQDMVQTVQHNKLVLKTNRASDVIEHKSNLNQFNNNITDINTFTPPVLVNTIKGKGLSIEIGEYKAELTYTINLPVDVSYPSTKELLKLAKVIAVISTFYQPLCEVACWGKNEAWICGYSNTLTRIDINGKMNVHIGGTGMRSPPNDIAVTVHGDLIYIDGRKGKIKTTGHDDSLVSIPQDWIPYRLCCSKSGDILICVSNGLEKKIIRYHEKKITQEIHKVENGKPIFEGKFSHALCIHVVENNNGDVCISDENAGVIIVVSLAGKIRFRYDGKPAKKNNQFSPSNIVTDSLGQIIIADNGNSCLHILDQDGQFIKCVDNCELDNVHALSVDDEGRFWAGLFESGIIKVIQYLE